MNLELPPYQLQKLLQNEISNLDEILSREYLYLPLRKDLRKMRTLLELLEIHGKADLHSLHISIAHRKLAEKVRTEFFNLKLKFSYLQNSQLAMICERLIAPRMATVSAPRIYLTPREKDVLYLISQGLSSDEIACALYVRLPTVKTHLASLYRKLGVKNRSQAILEAERHSLI